MSNTCILTDSTVQFPIPSFAGRNLVSILNLPIDSYQGKSANQLRAGDFPPSAPHGFSAHVHPPSVADFEARYQKLSQQYAGIVTIVHASALSPTYQHAVTAARNIEGQVEIEVIDAQTIATGLGLVVQAASKVAEEGQSAAEITELIRSLLPRVYTVFCIPGLSYLYHNRILGEAQAVVGEHLKMLPVYVIESGELNPTQKARNHRHLVDLLHEFITEFDTLDHLGLIQGVPPFETETRTLRERLALDFDHLSISEHIISPELALMFGPHSLGMFLLQSEF
ncbi:MAG: DegV family EDD domain-containing protein [Anaerolineales bacterium]|nr:DegV family EDD domain-containing protein [Anaerolineales bacterium]